MIHPDTEPRFISPDVGVGLVATAPIPKGTITWVRDPLDGGWPLEDVLSWPVEYRSIIYRTCLRIGHEVIQPWDHGRLLNHACDPNCAGTDLGFEIALRDIGSGEQLTNDYGDFALPDDPPFHCRCGSPWCRQLEVYRFSNEARRRLVAQVGAALRHAAGVPQPLFDLLAPGRLESALDASR